MSSFPATPSFNGPSHFIQQWAHGPPPMNAPDPSFNRDPSSYNSQQPQDGTVQSSGYDDVDYLRPNSRLPGLNVHDSTAQFPPPPFPFMSQMSQSQLPQSLFPAQMPPVAYPPMPMSGPFPVQQGQSPTSEANANPRPSNAFESQVTDARKPYHDLDREEGEVTDKEDGGLKSAERGLSGSRPIHEKHSRGVHVDVPRSTTDTNSGLRDRQDFGVNYPKASTRTVPDLEEGEAASSISSSSTRDSGSPYNPPISVSAEPYNPHYPTGYEMRDQPQSRAGDLPQANIALKDTRTNPDIARPPSQLRVQAQGALLGLAPHNIRYPELVGEGINPTVLRRLYEEVGIKVGTPQFGAARETENMPSQPDPSQSLDRSTSSQPTSLASDPQRTFSEKATVAEIPVGQGDVSPGSKKTQSATGHLNSPAQTEASKPLERKELIARMLAAKASKPSGEPQLCPDAAKESSISSASEVGDIDKAASGAPLQETHSKENDARAKEKKKAQTELAKQRIEQLKKQGLMRNQPKPQADRGFQAAAQQDKMDHPSAPSLPLPTAHQHPLPERPPEPESSRPALLPGLFLKASARSSSNEPHSWSDNSRSTDPLHPRGTQRKRPRASDFGDGPIMTKKPFGQGEDGSRSGDRLVIDISDDEFYGDDENDVDMETPAHQPQLDQFPQEAYSVISSDPKAPSLQKFPPSTDSLPQNHANSVDSRNSASATPQAWKNIGEENLRKKDLAIREMHKKIAELEKRKKPKPTASPTQSAHVVNSPTSSMDGHPTEADVTPSNTFAPAGIPAGTDVSENMNIVPQTVSETLSRTGNLEDVPAQLLASMDSAQLDRVRSRFLRRQEIEFGLPSLEAELLKSETRLDDFKKEQEKLLLEIAKGKEGHQQLLEELKSLDSEIDGLSVQDIEAAQRKLENLPQIPGNVSNFHQSPPGTGASVLDIAPPKSPNHKEIHPERQNAPPVQSQQAPVEPRRLAEAEETGHVTGSGLAASSTSLSESEGSAMDESSDSAIADSASMEETSDEPPAQGVTDTENLEKGRATGQDDTSYDTSDKPPHPLPERPRFAGVESRADGRVDVTNQEQEPESQASPESSDGSEAYEPPEPDPDTAVHSPHFSPAPRGPEDTVNSGRQLEQPHADRPLTGNAQDLDSDSRAFLQVGPLDNGPRTNEPERKFTPYTSPLKYFKAYRYHPRYADEVSDGYRSLTYSHNIDPMKYLCPFEAAGGACNDRSCEFQHFRDMNLSDDKVLIQMGSLREGKTPEEKDRYIAGLKQIINDMRRDSVKDFISVAREIAAYRRRFLQDSSRILPL